VAFTNDQIAEYAGMIEEYFWNRRRPPLNLRDKIREGQRITENAVELFFVRPLWNDPAQEVEEPIAKARYIKSRNVWRIYWMRADSKWHSYPPVPEVKTFEEFLFLVEEDANACFFG
jgi:hypothetical protein